MTGAYPTGPGPTLRRAVAVDAPAITALCITSKRSNGYDDAFMGQCEAELTVTGTDLNIEEWWVAETSAIVGCACLAASSTQGHGSVELFFVDPTSQRLGIGRMLWERLRERALARAMPVLVLDADPNAVDFYLDIGFVVTGETPSGSIAGRSLPRMQITLDA